MYAQNRNVTYIDDLPDLDDLEQQVNTNVYQETIPDKYKKFIRNSSQLLPESGMVPFYNPQPDEMPSHSKENNVTSQSMTCLDVHSHIMHCPICSKFFKFDNTVYIIAIVVLTIVCILLLKRVLNV